jgi:hypothetical protein
MVAAERCRGFLSRHGCARTVVAGLNADLLAVDGDPLTDRTRSTGSERSIGTTGR